MLKNMKSLSRFHPGTVCVYLLCVLLPVMFGINPITAGIGLGTGMLFWLMLEENARARSAAFYLLLPVVSGIINPVFNHNGVTVLFFLNGNPVTREAALNGAALGLVISAALLWARCFTLLMDTDRLLCVTGALSPRLSLVLSMTLRYIPLLRRQAGKTREAARAMGLMREDNAPDRLRSGMTVFSGLVTWTLENGAVTADSMTARGYGSGRRSRYRAFCWTRSDTAMTMLSLGLLGLLAGARMTGDIGFVWYPVYHGTAPTVFGIIGYAAYAALCLTGAALESMERWFWQRRLAQIPGEER